MMQVHIDVLFAPLLGERALGVLLEAGYSYEKADMLLESGAASSGGNK